MSRSRLKLAALALLMLGATATPSAASAQDAAADPAQQAADAARIAACVAGPRPGAPVTINGGAGLGEWPVFTLDQTDYAVTWVLAAPSDGAALYLVAVTGDAAHDATATVAFGPFGTPVISGQTTMHNLKPGRYFLHGRMPFDWSVTFMPSAI